MQNKKTLALVTIAVVSAIFALALYNENVKLKEQISSMEMQYEKGVIEGVTDFTLMIIDRLKTCQPVALMAEQESTTVVDVGCLRKE